LEHLKRIGLLQRWRGIVEIYSWSEPTLNPEIDTILKIANQYHQKARISSNFIVPWHIRPESYLYIANVIFSICSLNEDRYSK
jgi:hypothetical protein